MKKRLIWAGVSLGTALLLAGGWFVWYAFFSGPQLYEAVRYGRHDRIDLLLLIGANIEWTGAEGTTALIHAHEGSIIRLVEAGARVDVTNAGGQTPLHKAARKAWNRATIVLLNHGANSNAQDFRGRSPLFLMAREAARTARGAQTYPAVEDMAVLTQALLAAGANPDLPNNDGVTPRQLLEEAGIGVEEVE